MEQLHACINDPAFGGHIISPLGENLASAFTRAGSKIAEEIAHQASILVPDMVKIIVPCVVDELLTKAGLPVPEMIKDQAAYIKTLGNLGGPGY